MLAENYHFCRVHEQNADFALLTDCGMRQVAVVVAREEEHDRDRDRGNDFTCIHAHLTEMRVRARKQCARMSCGAVF